MFVVCAHAPGRIDGVVLLCVNGVLIYNPCGLPADACAAKELAQLACRMASAASSGAGKSQDVSYTDRSHGVERISATFPNLAIVDGLRADKRYIRAIRAQ